MPEFRVMSEDEIAQTEYEIHKYYISNRRSKYMDNYIENWRAFMKQRQQDKDIRPACTIIYVIPPRWDANV